MSNSFYAMTEPFEKVNHEIFKILNAMTYEDKEKEIFLCVGICLHWIEKLFFMIEVVNSE